MNELGPVKLTSAAEGHSALIRFYSLDQIYKTSEAADLLLYTKSDYS